MTGPEDGDREVGGSEGGEHDGNRDGNDREEVPDPEDPSDPSRPLADPDADDDVDDDRFERMEADDEVDPFADLDDGRKADHEAETTDHEAKDADDDGSPSREFGATTASGGADDGPDPFAELDASPDPDAPPGSVEDPFERMAVDEIDMDEVWDALDDDTDLPPAGGDGPGPDTRSDDVVDKRTYCQRCPHFAEPPETACTLEGTDIVEVIGFGEFRLRGCPMVSEEGPKFDRSR